MSTTFKINKNSDFTVMSNHHLRDKNLSLKAKGLLSYMLSLPDDWDYSLKGLVSICKENKDAIRASLNELKSNNYLIIERSRDENGMFQYKEQNSNFVDNYIEEEVDLSNVLFILTGNDEDKIPDALKDRLEIINLSSYTMNEKEDIALNYIIPKLSENYGINLKLTKKDIDEIIIHYTRESGVRQLERCIDTIFRKILVTGKEKKNTKVTDYLGNYKYRTILNEKDSYLGVINALGYTPYGGCIQKTTVLSYPGTGEIQMTGTLGDVIKESAYVAISYIKANNDLLEIDANEFKNKDFHIHFEGAAIPKDGPSAGLAVMTSLISLLKHKEIETTVSMTGEITLRGKVLPVGGIKEKVLAAINNNIKTIYVPIDNKEDVREIPQELLKGIKIKYINNYLELYNDLF